MSSADRVSSPVPPPFQGDSPLSSHCKHCGRALKSFRSRKDGICGPCFYDRRVHRWNPSNVPKFLKKKEVSE